MGRDEIKTLKVVLNPVYITPEENRARLERIVRFLFFRPPKRSHKK